MTKEMARVLPKMVKVDIADDLEGHILARDVLTAKGAVLLTRGGSAQFVYPGQIGQL